MSFVVAGHGKQSSGLGRWADREEVTEFVTLEARCVEGFVVDSGLEVRERLYSFQMRVEKYSRGRDSPGGIGRKLRTPA